MTNQVPPLSPAREETSTTSTSESRRAIFSQSPEGANVPNERPRRSLTAWQSVCRVIGAVFTACAAVVTVIDSPLAWAAWAFTAYCVAGYLGFTVFMTATGRGRRKLSEVWLALFLAGAIACTVGGSFAAADGLGDGARVAHAGREVKAALASVKRSLTAEVKKSIKEALKSPPAMALAGPLVLPGMIVRATSECGPGQHNKATAEAEPAPARAGTGPKAQAAGKDDAHAAPKVTGSGPGGTMAPPALAAQASASPAPGNQQEATASAQAPAVGSPAPAAPTEPTAPPATTSGSENASSPPAEAATPSVPAPAAEPPLGGSPAPPVEQPQPPSVPPTSGRN